MAPKLYAVRGPASVTVEVSPAPYEVRVEPALDLAGAISEVLTPAPAALLTDSNVGPLYAATVAGTLEEAGWSPLQIIEVPAGEGSKSLSVYEGVVRELAGAGLSRGAALFALGGGVVGDLGGFVASSYARGIDLVQLPTSLLAMVDSSVGGKVGLDLPEGKNLIGAFYQPRLVAANLDWLTTLPARERSHGLAEVVKMGLLSGGEFLEDLKVLLPGAAAGDAEALRGLILHSVRYKASVVAKDEREAGLRAVLNYGHTIGHGLEAAVGYGMSHGEAIAAGMLAAARLSREMFGDDRIPLHQTLLRDAGLLPLEIPPAIDAEAVLASMGRDKKRRASDEPNTHRFVLLEAPGRPHPGVPIPEERAREALRSILEP